MSTTTTKPYFIRALHEWCTDSGYTPYLAVWVDERVSVPMEFVKNNEIVLNIDFSATHNLHLGNEAISFSARFGGVSRDLFVPISNVISLFAKETGEGMGFEVEKISEEVLEEPPLTLQTDHNHNSSPTTPPPPRGRPQLRVIK